MMQKNSLKAVSRLYSKAGTVRKQFHTVVSKEFPMTGVQL